MAVVAGRENIERHWQFKRANEMEIVSLLLRTVAVGERKLTKRVPMDSGQAELVLIGLIRLMQASFE
ncbi:hypothetical protein [Caballeronia sordidicola]|uniref:Uncharacterized protein n=1 Tax=Caballeronia sordidicola TaxID=196367 RepID=A0A226X7J0_CABSO|nr:hypothetical protein [Caballeronia sordidicola]OXC78950.1 hypothetical protein BSU04_09855 [Caballeronia sordidicola]